MHESIFEKEIRLILEECGVEFKQYAHINGHELDFLIGNINIEVDGPFHDSKKRKIKDAFRDRYLKSLGYDVYRVKMYVSKKRRAQKKNEENKQKLLNFLKEKDLY